MLDIFGVHGLVVAVVALLVIGPKDMPKAMRVLGYWVGRARGVARQFRSGFDEMVREAELADMEKKWAAENARIMAEHSAGAEAEPAFTGAAHGVAVASEHGAASAGEVVSSVPDPDLTTRPVMVEKPVVLPAPANTPPAADAKADS